MAIEKTVWEEQSAADIGARYSELELKGVLAADPFLLDSIRYFMGKANMVRFLREPDARDDILAEAEVKRDRHRTRNRENRPKGAVKDRVKDESEGRSFRFLKSDRVATGFTDSITERRGKVAYYIEDIADGQGYAVLKATASVLEELGRLSGLVPHIPQSRSKKGNAAHEAGMVTLDDIMAGSDPEAAAVAEQIVMPDDELDDLLESL